VRRLRRLCEEMGTEVRERDGAVEITLSRTAARAEGAA
jgi:hypothetical protein